MAPTRSDPRAHIQRIDGKLAELADLLRRDSMQVTEPKAQALFETSAEVLSGLRTALSHYERGSEPAMREPPPRG